MLIDVKKSCPFEHDQAAPLASTISNNSWYISIKKRWVSYLIFSLLAIWSVYEIAIVLEVITAHVWLPIVLSLVSGVLGIQGYCKRVQQSLQIS